MAIVKDADNQIATEITYRPNKWPADRYKDSWMDGPTHRLLYIPPKTKFEAMTKTSFPQQWQKYTII